MLVSFLAAALMLQPANPKQPYPKTEKASLGSVYDCTTPPCRLVKAANADGTRTIMEIRSASDDTPPAAPTYAFYRAAKPIAFNNLEDPQNPPHIHPLLPNTFWWRYIRGIWPLEQTPRVAAASDGTNVIFVEGIDSANVPIEYVIVLPEDVIPTDATMSARASVTVTFQGETQAMTAQITVDGQTCPQLQDLERRLTAARFRSFTGTPGGVITASPGPDEPAKPVRDDATVERIVREVLAIAETKGNLRKAVQPPPSTCP